MKKPVHVTKRDENSLLYFAEPGVTDESQWEAKEYFMVGGICFPELFQASDGQELTGYVITCGKAEDTQVITVFEQQKFVTITDIIDPETNVIEHYGITSFFNTSWQKYYCDMFFWSQDKIRHKHYLLEILNTPLINPKPDFPESRANIDDMIHAIWTLVTTGKLRFERDSTLHKELDRYKVGDNNPHPSIHALTCAVAGFDVYRKWEE